LNDVAVSGATSNGWTFTPTSSGIYYVYLKVVDSNNNVVQSEAAKVSVASVPVGGYSISLVKQTPLSSLVAYAFAIVLSAAALGLAKRGRKFL
jgi:Na+(H+)/acetate symporter ActP